MSVAPGYRTRVDALADFGPLEVHRCAVFALAGAGRFP
jgi:hypothetical protein